jgi:hypothetical protein
MFTNPLSIPNNYVVSTIKPKHLTLLSCDEYLLIVTLNMSEDIDNKGKHTYTW